MAVRRAASLPLAYARASIAKRFFERMDGRVKPGHDDA
jgi:hypothetical protein